MSPATACLLTAVGCCLLVCLPSLQRVHKFEVMVTRKAEGREGKAFIGNMTEEKSVELASKLASESFLFAVSGGCSAVSGLACGRVSSMPTKASNGPRTAGCH
jgi:hypothetical protein